MVAFFHCAYGYAISDMDVRICEGGGGNIRKLGGVENAAEAHFQKSVSVSVPVSGHGHGREDM